MWAARVVLVDRALWALVILREVVRTRFPVESGVLALQAMGVAGEAVVGEVAEEVARLGRRPRTAVPVERVGRAVTVQTGVSSSSTDAT